MKSFFKKVASEKGIHHESTLPRVHHEAPPDVAPPGAREKKARSGAVVKIAEEGIHPSVPVEKVDEGTPEEAKSHSSSASGEGKADVVAELQKQLLAAVERNSIAETKLDRAISDVTAVRKQREELRNSLAQAEVKVEKLERQNRQKDEELSKLVVELEGERRRREEAERSLEEQRRDKELLTWKLQEMEEHAVGLRSVAAQAEGSIEMARAEVVAVEARAKEEAALVRAAAAAEVERMKEEAAVAQERVTWLEEELVAMKDRVALAEFRLREEVSRAEALVVEADEISAKLKAAEALLEENHRKYGTPVPQKHKLKIYPTVAGEGKRSLLQAEQDGPHAPLLTPKIATNLKSASGRSRLDYSDEESPETSGNTEGTDDGAQNELGDDALSHLKVVDPMPEAEAADKKPCEAGETESTGCALPDPEENKSIQEVFEKGPDTAKTSPDKLGEGTPGQHSESEAAESQDHQLHHSEGSKASNEMLQDV